MQSSFTRATSDLWHLVPCLWQYQMSVSQSLNNFYNFISITTQDESGSHCSNEIEEKLSLIQEWVLSRVIQSIMRSPGTKCHCNHLASWFILGILGIMWKLKKPTNDHIPIESCIQYHLRIKLNTPGILLNSMIRWDNRWVHWTLPSFPIFSSSDQLLE